MKVATEQLARNVERVREQIARAAESADRDPGDIRLIAVTKYVDADVIRALFDLGCRRFGESRPQVLWKKAEELADLEIEWHQIGHLQTNKVRRTLPHLALLHAGDSRKLLQCVDEESSRIGRSQPVLCEVNISGDETKHGFTTEQLRDCIAEIDQLPHIQIHGLMAMASGEGGPQQARRDFENLRALHEELRDRVSDPGVFRELSMGMSGDFEQAIACGATLVRIGSVLFDGLL